MNEIATTPFGEDLALDSKSISMQTGFAFALRDTATHGVPHLRPFNIGNDGRLDLSKVVFLPEKSINGLQTYWLQPGDILFNNTNSVELVGKSALVSAPMECAFSNHITRLRLRDRTTLDPAWLALYLHILWMNGFFAERCHRWIGQAGFNATELALLKVPAPPLDLQRKIIDRVDALISDLREARNTVESMRQDIEQVIDGALLEIFAHTRDGFKIINTPSEEIKEITQVTQIERGKFTPRPRNDPRFFGGSIPWVQIQNLPKDKGEKYITSYMNTLNDLGLGVSRLFPKNTLVLSIAATIGAVGILTFDACFPDSLVGITPDLDVVDAGFLYWQLVFIQEYLEQIAPSAAQKNINLKILEQIELWIPSKTTQTLINAHLDGIQEGIGHLLEMSNEDEEILKQVEQSILERAFKGEI